MSEAIQSDKKILQIFNLQFPDYIEEIKISDYLFKRVENYQETFSKMMHLSNTFGSEFGNEVQTGSHQITATVEVPKKEKKAILPFADQASTQLDDILFLLTLFADRNIFKKDWEENKNIAITSDHRLHQYGGLLACSIEYESKWKNRDTGALKTDSDMKNVSILNYDQINIGFENTINKILDLISSEKWQQEYEGGYFLFLFKSAIQRQIIETSFTSCWTIWEHIFAIKNRNRLDNTSIVQISADKKIAFILKEYFLKNINDTARKNIQKIKNTRNSIVHFGKKTEEIDYKEMEMFIRLTEQLMAIILELRPTNTFNSFEKLDSFLKVVKK